MYGIGDRSCIIVPTQTTITMNYTMKPADVQYWFTALCHSIAMYKCNFNIVCIDLLMYIMLTGWEVYMHDHMHSAKACIASYMSRLVLHSHADSQLVCSTSAKDCTSSATATVPFLLPHVQSQEGRTDNNYW